MLTRSEYDRAIEIFLVELNSLCDHASDSELRALPQFAKVIDEYIEDFCDPTNDAARTLRLAFAFLDWYCYADREKVNGAAFEQHKIDQSPPESKLD